MNKEDHKKAIDDLAEVSKLRKKAAERVLRRINTRKMVLGSPEEKLALKRAFIAAAIKETDRLMAESVRIGKGLAEKKLA